MLARLQAIAGIRYAFVDAAGEVFLVTLEPGVVESDVLGAIVTALARDARQLTPDEVERGALLAELLVVVGRFRRGAPPVLPGMGSGYVRCARFRMTASYSEMRIRTHVVGIERLERLRWRVTVDGRRLFTFCTEARARDAGRLEARCLDFLARDAKSSRNR